MPFIKTPEIWSDIHQDIVKDSLGNVRKSINADAVKTSINNILNTYKGERIFLPEFGSGMRGMLFEPMSQYKMDSYARLIKDAIERWDDRVIIEGIDLKVDTDNHYVEVITRFSIKSFSQSYSTSTVITS